MKIIAFGEELSVDEWASKLGIKPATIIARIYARGWSPEEAVSTPLVGMTAQWDKEHAAVLSGAAAGEYAHETAKRLGWSEDRVSRIRRSAIRILGAVNLPNAVAIAMHGQLIAFSGKNEDK